MGKSPGKWIKSVLLGKKSLKSNPLKRKNASRTPNCREVTVSSKASVSGITGGEGLPIPPAPQLSAGSGVDIDDGLAANLPDEGVNLPCPIQDENGNEATYLGSSQDLEIIKHEKAAIKAQAAIRGYLARCAFQTLKGVIRLQALVRGHLVRRQAVATLCCMGAIVKFQALARGQKVRRSSIGIEVQNTCNLGKIKTAKSSVSSGVRPLAITNQLPENVFARKLLASTSGPLPLSLQYGPEQPNSAGQWLERWSMLFIWASNSKIGMDINSKPQVKRDDLQSVEIQQGRSKRSVQKPFHIAKVENKLRSSNPNKPNSDLKKSSGFPVDKNQIHPQSESEKIKRNVRKVSNLTKETVEKSKLDNEKLRSSAKKVSSPTASEGLLLGIDDSTDKLKDKVVTVPKQFDDAGLLMPMVDDDLGALHERLDLNMQEKNNGEVDHIEGTNRHLKPKDHIDNGILQSNLRRSSFPPNTENEENGVQSMPKVPSYMAPTESARAKLRAQGSPSCSQDAIEKNAMTRRLSLPSSASGRLSMMSPRAQRPVHPAKAGIRIDKSLSTSRDGNVSDKLIKPEWRR